LDRSAEMKTEKLLHKPEVDYASTATQKLLLCSLHEICEPRTAKIQELRSQNILLAAERQHNVAGNEHSEVILNHEASQNKPS
jgi:hypothetical protein